MLSHAGRQIVARRSRSETKRVIREYVSTHPGATRAEIAAMLGVASHPWLWRVLGEMVDSGVLSFEMDETVYPSMYRYSLA